MISIGPHQFSNNDSADNCQILYENDSKEKNRCNEPVLYNYRHEDWHMQSKDIPVCLYHGHGLAEEAAIELLTEEA